MSSICNRIYDDGLGLLGPQKNVIRTRRLSVRKQQLYRREDLTAAELLYTYTTQPHSEALWALSSCSSSRPRHMKEAACCAPSAAAPKNRRNDLASTEESWNGQSRSAGGLVSLTDSSSVSAQAHLGIGSKTDAFTSCQQQHHGPVPLPPATFRADLPGSPLSLCDAHYESEYTYQRPMRSTYVFGGSRAMGTGGRSSVSAGGRGGGASPVPSGVHPGQEGNDGGNDDVEGDESEGGRPKPSSYTFRRRNAIVEGSEDAPKANDFPNSS